MHSVTGTNATLKPRKDKQAIPLPVNLQVMLILRLPQQQRGMENPKALQAGLQVALKVLHGFKFNTHMEQVGLNGVRDRCHVCP